MDWWNAFEIGLSSSFLALEEERRSSFQNGSIEQLISVVATEKFHEQVEALAVTFALHRQHVLSHLPNEIG